MTHPVENTQTDRPDRPTRRFSLPRRPKRDRGRGYGMTWEEARTFELYG